MTELKQQHTLSQPTEFAIQDHLHQLILSNWMRVQDEQAVANNGPYLSPSYHNTGIESIQSNQLQTSSSPIESLSADVLLAKRLFGSGLQAPFNEFNSTTAIDSSSSSHLLLLFALLVLINLIVILGNILVILAVYATAKLRNVTNIFIVSLATADLLLGVLVLPYALMFEILDVWVFGRVWCRGWLVTDVWISTASILNLCAISVDRYVAVTRPVKYRSIMTPRRAKSIVAGVWIVSFLICFPPLLPQWNPSGQSTAQRYKRQLDYDISLQPDYQVAQDTTTVREPNLGHPNIEFLKKVGFASWQPLIVSTSDDSKEEETFVSGNATLVMVIDNELLLLCMVAPVKVAQTGFESRPQLDLASIRNGQRLRAAPLGAARSERFVSGIEGEMQSDMKSFLQGQQQHRSMSHLKLRQQTMSSNGIQAKLNPATQSLRKSCKELEGRNILEALQLLTGCTLSPSSYSLPLLRNIIKLCKAAQFTSKDEKSAKLCYHLLEGAQFGNQEAQNSKLKSPHTKTKYNKLRRESEWQNRKRKPSNGTTETNEQNALLVKCLMLLSLTAQDEMDSGCLLWPNSGCLRSSKLVVVVVVESTKLEAAKKKSKSKLNPNSFRPREVALSSSGAKLSLVTSTQLDALLRVARRCNANADSGGRLLVVLADRDYAHRLASKQSPLRGDKDIDYLEQAICINRGDSKQLDGLRLLLTSLYCNPARRINARDQHPRGRVKRDMALVSESRQKSGCALFDDKPYVIYSALGSFYIPMLIMIFFYSRIYLVASRAHKAVQRGYMTTKWPLPSAGFGSYKRYGPNAPERVTLRIHRRGQESGETLARDGSLIKAAASEQQQATSKAPTSNNIVSSNNAASANSSTNENNDDRQEPDRASLTVTKHSDNPLATSAPFALIESDQERRSELINGRLEDNNEPSSGFHMCEPPTALGGSRRITDSRRQRHNHHNHHHHHHHHHHHRHRHHRHHHHHHHKHHRDTNGRSSGRHQHLKQRHCSCRHKQEGVAAVTIGRNSNETLMRSCIVEEAGNQTPVLPSGTSELSSGRSLSSVQITVSQYDEDENQLHQGRYQGKPPLLTVTPIKCERSQSVQVQDTQDSDSRQKRLDRSHSCGIAPTIVVSWNPESGCTTTKALSNEHLEVEESKQDQLNLSAGSQLSGLSMVANLPTQVRKQSMMLLSTISMRSSQTLRRLSMVASHPVDSLLKRSKSRDETHRASSDSSCSNETDKVTIKKPKKTIDDFLMQVAGVDGSSEDEGSGEGEQENADDGSLSEDSLHYSLLFGHAATPSPEDKPAIDKPSTNETKVELATDQRPSSGLQRKGAYYERATSRAGQLVDAPRQVGTSNQVCIETTGEGNIRRRGPKRTSRWHAKRLHAETKAAKTVAIIIGGFIFCWLPFFTAYLSRAIICERPDCIPQSLLSLFIWLGYLNSAINPVIYGLFSADFRHAFKNILCRCRFRNTDDTVVVSVLVDSIIKSIL